ncbi:MAG: DUF2244 domain-containing protein [Pseudomonadota bacterium]
MVDLTQKIETLAQFFELTARGDDPQFQITLWPHRSLSKKGFVTTILLICFGFTIPLSAFFGTPIFWAVLVPIVLTVWGLWTAIQSTNKDATLTESLKLWPDMIAVYRKNPRAEDQFWIAHPAFVRVNLRKDTDVKNYITLTGGNREIELGSFLTPQERIKLFEKLDREIYRAKFSGMSAPT